MRIAAGLLLVAALAPAPSCRTVEDKRIFQYLNQSGFGRRYQGIAAEENYAAVGDTVSVSDALNPDLTLPAQPVDIDGTIDMPEIGSVHVAGLTAGEIEALLTERFRPYFEDLRLRVRIRSRGKIYYVFGEVALQGPKAFLLGEVTVLDAVIAAAPSEIVANLSRVRLVRGDPVDPMIVEIDLERILRTGDTTYNLRLREDDILVVPPTLLGAIGHALDELLFPVTKVLGTLLGVLNAVTIYQWRRNFF